GTGYKDEKSLKIIIDKLIDLDLIERIENKDGYKTIYTYDGGKYQWKRNMFTCLAKATQL
ncbi:MAG: hypothetical protein RSB38_07405, partial [Oscillospiraceae bacterium]